ncbi:NADH:ubiquinone oxidoreductase 6.6kD subunit [Daldinia grandis]|nr:NADH:ubiquinone oxidoreductase 6.6kD subunit [Daldinia grandis]
MVGVEHYRMAMDPAIQKLGNMTTNRHKFFRWTPRTARIAFMYTIAVPAIFGVIAYTTDGKYDLRVKRKGDMIKEF